MRKLVIQADDLGLSEGVSEGILSAFQKGAVTAASLLTNFPTSRKAMEQAKAAGIDLGLHCNLTQGKPLSPADQIPTLVRGDGSFYPLPSLIRRSLLRQLKSGEVEKELQAQLNFFLESGVRPTHLDGHHHAHIFPAIREAVRKILSVHRIPFVRTPLEKGGPTVPRFAARTFLRTIGGSNGKIWSGLPSRSLPFYGLGLGCPSLASWEKLLMRISTETAEVMVHPGLDPGERKREWTVLTDPEWKRLVQKLGFELVSFRDLR